MNFDLSSMGLCLGRGKSTRRCCTVFAYTGDTKNLAICNIYHCNHFLRLLARSIITSIIFVCNVACDLYKWLPATFDNRKQISNSLNYSTVCDELCMSRYIIFLLKLYALNAGVLILITNQKVFIRSNKANYISRCEQCTM